MPANWSVLHVIGGLSRGGASRAASALANAQAREPGARIAMLSLTPAEAAAGDDLNGVTLIDRVRWRDVFEHVASSDIVHAHVWNAPEIFEFLRLPLLARLVIWFHVASRATPQRIPAAILDQADAAILSSSVCAMHRPFSQAIAPLQTIVPTRDISSFLSIARRRSSSTICGHVGSLDPLRVPEHLLAHYANPLLGNVQFDFAGGGPLLADLRHEAEQRGLLGRTRFHGPVARIDAFLGGCDIFGCPQGPLSYATSDMAIEEAMAAGLSCVLLSPEGASDLVHHRTTGHVANNMAGYIASLVELAGNPDARLEFGTAARAHAASMFRPERTAASFRNVYEGLLAEKKTAHNDLRIAPRGDESPGAEAMIFAFADDHPEFLRSINASTPTESQLADEAVAALEPRIWSTTQGGIRHYQTRYPRDPWLAFWSGLGYLRGNAPVRAMLEFRKAVDLGFNKSRIAAFEKEGLARARQ